MTNDPLIPCRFNPALLAEASSSGWPEVNPAFLYICLLLVSSFWLFEQCSKFNLHLYVQSVRPEFGDHDIARSNSPISPYFDNIAMVTGSPLTTPSFPILLKHNPNCTLGFDSSRIQVTNPEIDRPH
ncbi:hypothetical protein L211DRAFT_839773 [Terfezia boudieri ATCC MYA-4762]|uniref:Uncharacterized protein n=1 Tax=Terfezia boudieri ATCC MYA-4762 TaxID=1051890 RepID=A0A3N4LKY7_9PEZI|nr:hypothetical protein L211DRAFT_839773 [Terfezia boudieri ATCC MYA-4762]